MVPRSRWPPPAASRPAPAPRIHPTPRPAATPHPPTQATVRQVRCPHTLIYTHTQSVPFIHPTRLIKRHVYLLFLWDVVPRVTFVYFKWERYVCGRSRNNNYYD